MQKELVRFIHIGYPKNFSTTLQRDYFAAHSQIKYLGIGTDNNNLGYSNSDVEKALEVYLKTCKKPKYRLIHKQLKEAFEKELNDRLSTKKAVGISCEHLSFSFTHDGLDHIEKADRLVDLFDANAKIIIVLRNQIDLVKSLYKESIRQGLYLSFEEYLQNIYQFQDRNYLYDLRYHDLINYYKLHFGKDNVQVLFFENYKNNDQFYLSTLFSDLSQFLGIKNEPLEIQHHNRALSDEELNELLVINKGNRHNLGNSLSFDAETHRAKRYWIDDLKMDLVESEIYRDVLKKRQNIEEARLHKGVTINMKYKGLYFKRLQSFFREANIALSKEYEEMPKSYLF